MHCYGLNVGLSGSENLRLKSLIRANIKYLYLVVSQSGQTASFGTKRTLVRIQPTRPFK